MKQRIFLPSALTMLSLLSLTGCSQSTKGRINFELNGGAFSDTTFSTNYIEGVSGTPVMVTIPDPVLSGYYFVGWREKDSDGSYREISKRQYEDGNSYYYYPYGSDTFYAYFEPLVTLTFDLNEGKDKGAVVNPPLYDAKSFSGNVLSGYAGKTIQSTDYLPTASVEDEHMSFAYWYTEYPLVSSVDDNKQTHFHLDTTAEKSYYRFDQEFNGQFMSFPMDENVTLYAAWSYDPTIRVHFNLDDVADTSFQAKDTVKDELSELFLETLGIDFSHEEEYHYYPSESKENRFAGLYLDPEFKNQFYLNSTISSNDIDLYVKWNHKASVHLDFNGGSWNGLDAYSIEDVYYVGDSLNEDFLTAYAPSKEYATFQGYALDGKEFNFRYDKIPSEEITLVASYEEFLTLTLDYDYPDNYVGEELTETYRVEKESDISSLLAGFSSRMSDATLDIGQYYYVDASAQQITFTGSSLTEDRHLYLSLSYKAEVQVLTYLGEYASTYSYLDSQSPIIVYTGNGEKVEESSLFGLKDDLLQESTTYLYEGIYTDSALQNECLFPIAGENSSQERKVITLYRKMTKAVKLTFCDYTTEDDLNLSLNVLPASQVSAYQSELTSLLGTYSSLIIKEGGEEYLLEGILPSVDTVVYVKR